LVFLFLLTAFGMQDFKINQLEIITTFLDVKALYKFASSSKELHQKITKNIPRYVWFQSQMPESYSNDFTWFADFEVFADSDFEVFAEFEKRLEWVKRSFEIQKIVNGFEVIPVNHYEPLNVCYKILVDQNKNVVMFFNEILGEIIAEKLLLSSEIGEGPARILYRFRYGAVWKNLLHYSAIDQHQNQNIISRTTADSLTLGKKQISITPGNIEYFFRLCANEDREIIETVLFTPSNWIILRLEPMSWFFNQIFIGYLFYNKIPFKLFFLLQIFSLFFVVAVQNYPIRGRLARFIGRNSANRILVSFGFVILYVLIVYAISGFV